jgi:hypothetical protein
VQGWPTPILGSHQPTSNAERVQDLRSRAVVPRRATRTTRIVATHPVQTYVDLRGQPERADEAAEHLRSTVLSPGWLRDD